MNYQEIEKTAYDKMRGQLTQSSEKKYKDEKHADIVHGIQNNMKMPQPHRVADPVKEI